MNNHQHEDWGMRWFFTADMDDFIMHRISIILNGKYSHTGPVFYPPGEEPVYFDSIWKKDPETGKTGPRGPRPLKWLSEWHKENPSKRKLCIYPHPEVLPFTHAEVMAAYNKALWATKNIKYAKFQIALNWIEHRIGFSIHSPFGSRKKWTCSEFDFRLVPQRFWHYFGIPNLRADSITPSGKKVASIYEATLKMVDDMRKKAW